MVLVVGLQLSTMLQDCKCVGLAQQPDTPGDEAGGTWLQKVLEMI
jgi:hypothetical protein